MLLKNLLSTLTVLLSLLLISCSDDDAAKNKETPQAKNLFTFADIPTGLANARIYLVYDGTNANKLYREYAITDGTYSSGDGKSISGYNDATFVAVLRLDTFKDSFTEGEYDLDFMWSSPTKQYSYLMMYIGQTFIGNTMQSEGSFVIEGGMNDGQNISISYTGNLLVGSNYVDGELKFSGKVEDISKNLVPN
jgi:hypothetical protein